MGENSQWGIKSIWRLIFLTKAFSMLKCGNYPWGIWVRVSIQLKTKSQNHLKMNHAILAMKKIFPSN